jgi:hypothetical protein
VRGEVQAAWMELDLRMIAPLVQNLTLGMELGGAVHSEELCSRSLMS